MEILSAYKFTVRHVPGVSIPHVDALSRIPNRPCDPNCPTCTRIERKEAENLETNFALVKWTTISPADGISTEQMARDQYEDADLKPLIDALLSEHRPLLQAVIGRSSTTRALWHQFSSLILLNKVLYRKFEHTSGKPELIRYQLILPEKHTTKTVKYYHSGIACGHHYGREKTLALLKRYFYWPNMFDTVASVINKCETCFKAKGPTHRVRHPMKLFREGVMRGSWVIDHLGPLPPSQGDKYRYILIAVETFSNWPVAIPTKTTTSLEIAQKLIENVFTVYGAPNRIHSDQGRGFEANLLRDIMTLYGVTKTRTTPFNPKANGQVEVMIKTLTPHLKMMVHQNQKDWPKYLPLICQVYRALPTSARRYSPYEIMFGEQMRLPVDLVRGKPPTQPPCLSADVAYKDYPLALRQHLWNIHKEVRDNIHAAAKKMKQNYDRTANYIPFEARQLVWLFTPTRVKGLSPKLQSPWSGPHKILSILNDVVVRIQNVQNPRKIQHVNVDRIAPYHCAQ